MQGSRSISKCCLCEFQEHESSPHLPSFSQYLSLTFSTRVHSVSVSPWGLWASRHSFPQTPGVPVE